MKKRQLIGLVALDKILHLVKKRIPIATAVRVVGIDQEMHSRTAYNIVKADLAGKHRITRPEWLKPEPAIQTSPDGYFLTNGFAANSHWRTYEN